MKADESIAHSLRRNKAIRLQEKMPNCVVCDDL